MSKQSVKDRALWLQFRDLFVSKQENLTCAYCKKALVSDAPLNPRSPKHHIFKRQKGLQKDLIATVDHVNPVSKGGERFNISNLVIACNDCNGKKADMSPEQWNQTLAKGTEP